MSDFIHTIQHQFDSILFEEGCFSAIAWLLREGRLDYSDYRKWRIGETIYLEDHFKVALPDIIAGLKQAQCYAEKLKLDSFCQPYTSVDQQSLKICRSAADELMFTTVYQPAEDRLQTDLFFDSAPVFAAQDLSRAIVDRRDDVISVLMVQLSRLAPDKHTLFKRLLEEQEQLTGYLAPESKIKFLHNTLTPLAFNVLGRFANDFLTPLWQLLSLELLERKFDVGAPEAHLSFTAFRAFQWQDVILSIEKEKDWKNQPELLFRHAEACFKLNRELQGLESWFRLFTLYPESAKGLSESTGNYLLLNDWRSFNELDPELEPAFFPAWMVLRNPALAKIKVDFDGENIGLCSLQLIRGLAACADNGINKIAINLRADLRRQNPSLFIHYMAAQR